MISPENQTVSRLLATLNTYRFLPDRLADTAVALQEIARVPTN